MNAKCPGEGLESHRNRKGKVREALGFTPPVLLEKAFHSYLRASWSPAVQHVIRLTTPVGSDLLSASSAGLPSASGNWQSAVSGGGHFMVRFKSVPPWARQTAPLTPGDQFSQASLEQPAFHQLPLDSLSSHFHR